MKTYTEQELKDAHRANRCTKEDIDNSKFIGCFYCCESFRPKDKPIKEWVWSGQDPLCPICGIDSIIPGNSGFPVMDKDFLAQMHNHWFAISKGGKPTGEIEGGKK